jgi:D-alanyl-D-alanine carboxypeptidase (penicillin-binding protein 5/6)
VSRRRWALGAGLAALVLVAPAAGAPPQPTVASFILVDPVTGDTLAERAPDRRLAIASITKVMTALLTVERADPDALVTVPRAALVGGSSADLVPGERIAVRDLLAGLLVASGNDAALTLAQHIAGSETAFVGLMNSRARELGLDDTQFASPHGLDRPNHYSTARDLIRLAEVAMRHDEFRQLVGNHVYTIPGPDGVGTRDLRSENDLLALDPEVDGIKTGHTDQAGYTLVAHARRPSVGVELYAVLLGSPSLDRRAADAKALLDWGFAQYQRPVVVRADRVYARAAVRGRPGIRVALRPVSDLRAPMRVGSSAALRETIVAPAAVRAPVRAGQVLGRVVVRNGTRVVGRRDLVAADAISGPSLWDRLRAGFDRLMP